VARNAQSVADQIVAIRDRWHTKNHPFFQSMSEGKLPLKALAKFQALHYQYVARAAPSFGVFYSRAYQHEDVRKMIAENVAEEEGLKAIDRPGHEAQDHNDLIFRFCRAAGMSDEEVRNVKITPAWWARMLYYAHVTTTEPVGVALAMQTTQEGQMPGLMIDVVLPAFEKHYGFKRNAPEIEFFTEHAEADMEHSSKQMELCVKYCDTPELEARALAVAQQMVELRWASISDVYRSEVLRERDLLPVGVA
jgi:pyrroloquinoline quinone (PQQ) biosynthesis protein C